MFGDSPPLETISNIDAMLPLNNPHVGIMFQPDIASQPDIATLEPLSKMKIDHMYSTWIAHVSLPKS